MCNLRSSRQDPRRAPAPHGEGLPRAAPRGARAGTASSPRVGARGTRSAPAPAPTPPTARLRVAAGRTPAELPAPASPAPQGPATHRLEAPGCPRRRGPRLCGQEAARARGHPQPPAQGRPGTRDSGQWHSRGPRPPHPAQAPVSTPGLAPGTHQVRVKVAGRRRRRRRSTVTRVQSGGRDGAARRGPRRAGCGLGARGCAAAPPAAGWRLQRVGPGGATAGE